MDDAARLGEIEPEEIIEAIAEEVNDELNRGDEVIFDEMDYQQIEINDQHNADLNLGDLVDGEGAVINLEEAVMIEDVVIIAPAVNVANIFRKEGTKCDSEEVIAAACANFAVPEGWTRLELI